MRTLSLVLACSLPLLAAACLHPSDTGLPPLGEATDRMIAVQKVSQSVDPTPPEGSGAQGALAVQRYKNGQVRELAPPSSSTSNFTRDTQ